MPSDDLARMRAALDEQAARDEQEKLRKKMPDIEPGAMVMMLAQDGETVYFRYREPHSLDPKGLLVAFPADELMMCAAQLIMIRQQLKAAMPGSGRILRPT